MKKPTRKQLEAMVSLKNNEHFRIFMEWVSQSETELAMRSLDIPQEPQRSWMQGQAKQLGYLRGAVNAAEDTLNTVVAQGAPGTNQSMVI